MDDKTPPTTAANPPNARTADALRELHERLQSALSAQRARMSQLETQLSTQLDLISQALEDQTAAQAEKMDQARQTSLEADHLRRELEMAQVAWHAEHEHQVNELAQCREELNERQAKLDIRAAELDASRSQAELRQQALDRRSSELDERQRKLDDREQALEAREQELSAFEQGSTEAKKEAADAARKLQEERHDLAARETALRTGQQQLYQEREELAVREQGWHSERSALHAERDELRQKFELALEDVQRLRHRVTELEQELASRPAADQTDSVELVHLRAERDALAARVEELERQTAAPANADNAQEMADLQRRFELAVEDVRDLKKKNAQLESELAEARARSGSAASADDSGQAGWELLKKQMLADLEGEGDDDIGIEREKERTTIESTIRITDEVVANKDREIAELKSQLAAAADRPSAQEEAVRELVDADEVIQQHRARIAKLEQEMEEKLRAAELELSVERAKIAREKAQLDDLRAELESQRHHGEPAAPGQPPKRRWLSKLGLAGEDEGQR